MYKCNYNIVPDYISDLIPPLVGDSYWRKYVHEVLVNRFEGLSLSRKNVVRLTDRPDMTLDVYCGRKTIQQNPLVGEVPNCPLRNANDFMASRIRTVIFRKSCIPSSVALWNSLDSSVRNTDSFKRFKNILKTSLFPKIPTCLSKGNR